MILGLLAGVGIGYLLSSESARKRLREGVDKVQLNLEGFLDEALASDSEKNTGKKKKSSGSPKHFKGV